jgi:hypothetical protein
MKVEMSDSFIATSFPCFFCVLVVVQTTGHELVSRCPAAPESWAAQAGKRLNFQQNLLHEGRANSAAAQRACPGAIGVCSRAQHRGPDDK